MDPYTTSRSSPSPLVAQPPPFSLQARMVILTYLAYFFFYFTRKHLSIVTSSLEREGFSLEMIGIVNSCYAVCYMAGQFLSGALGDRKGPRIALCAGMILSGIATAAFGFFPFMAVLAIGYTLNGLFQSTGWPNCCKIMTSWVSERRRGRVMGFWLTCYILGSMLATLFAAYVLEAHGWKAVFLSTGAIVAVIGIAQGIFLINRPEDLGYRFEVEASTDPMADAGTAIATAPANTPATPNGGFWKMLRNPAVLLLGFSYFGLKYTRYTLFAWLPFYLEHVAGLTGKVPAQVSNGFEAGGVIGLLCGGFFADRLFPANRCRLAFLAMLGLIAAVTCYRYGHFGSELYLHILGLAGIGFFLYIADSIVSGTVAQDIGGSESAASACGIINGIGSIGQILSGYLPVAISKHFGWNAVFVSFIVFGVLSSVILLPLALRPKVGGERRS